jgi:hypothetical protein
MTAFAKSLKNEGASDSKPASQQTQPTDPYEGIDLDELPDNVRAAISKARGEFTTLQTKATEAETKASKAEHFARQQQSEKDRLAKVVKNHNLPTDNNPPLQSNDRQAVLAAQFEKDGLKPEAALAYAKMFITSNEMLRNDILRDITPLAASVGNLQADTLLASVQVEKAQVFQIPEVKQMVTDNLAALVSQGSVISKETIEHLTQMAYGAYAMSNPTKPLPNQQPQQIPNFSQNMTSGNLPNNTQRNQSGTPTATQAETVSIMAALNGHLRHGLPPKK